jgi:hypothetical protein
MPDLTIDQFYTTQFDANWQHLVQQSDGRAHARVRQESVTGKRKLLNFIGKSKARLITTRSGKTIPSNTPLAKRKLSLRAFDEVYHEDEWDAELLGEVTSPRSAVVAAHAKAFQRSMDESVLVAAIGTAYIGEDGTEAVDLPASQKVAVSVGGADSGLNLAKLIAARSILGKNEADGEPLYFFYSQKQLDNLLTNVNQVNSSDYNNVKALVEGRVTNFMGFEFIKTELLPINTSTNVRSCIAMAASGVAFAKNGMNTKIIVRDDLNETLQIRTKARYGATRTEEEKVVEIACDEDAA